MLAICEDAVLTGELPDLSGWDAVWTNTSTSSKLTHRRPPGTDLAMETTRRA